MFGNYSECLKEKNKISRSQQSDDRHDVYTEEIDKIYLTMMIENNNF